MDEIDHLLAQPVFEQHGFGDIAFADVEPFFWQAPVTYPPWVAVLAQPIIIVEPPDVHMLEIEPPVPAITFGMTQRVDPPTPLVAAPAPAGGIDETPHEYGHPMVSWF